VIALDDFSLTIPPGQVTGLIGPNGAGKTTFIDAVTGFTKYSGEILIDGRDLRRSSARQRAQAGLGRSFQSLELFDDLTVADNLRVAADKRTTWSYLGDLVHPASTSLSPAAVAAVREFALGPDLDRRPSELSFARRRMVGIARTIAASPGVMLLDEPAAGLDEVESRELGTLVRRLATEWNLAILLVEHDIELVMRVCDEVAVLDFGRKIAQGTPEEIRGDPSVIAAYLGEPEQTPSALAPERTEVPG
jgi:ABC-type branched-subunit amino acid transport system ATPase component